MVGTAEGQNASFGFQGECGWGWREACSYGSSQAGGVLNKYEVSGLIVALPHSDSDLFFRNREYPERHTGRTGRHWLGKCSVERAKRGSESLSRGLELTGKPPQVNRVLSMIIRPSLIGCCPLVNLERKSSLFTAGLTI